MNALIARSRVARPARQRGAAALAVSLVLLFGMTLIAFFVNRNMVFEQRTSANQYRATKAFEVAEAGLEWAVARINDTNFAASAPSCDTSTSTAATLQDRYLVRDAAGNLDWSGAGRRLMACRVSAAGVVNCACPGVGTAPSWASDAAADARFLVEFLPGPDSSTLRVVSRGCTNAGAECELGSGSADANAVVTALFKIKPGLPGAPGAGLVTGAAANVTGNLTVINKDPKSHGITVHSGSIVDLAGSTSVVTIDGTAPRASVLDNDPALRDLTNMASDPNGDAFFRSFFNDSIVDFKSRPTTHIITSGSCAAYGSDRCTTCANAGTCGQAIADAWKDKNREHFWADTDVNLASNNYAQGQSSHGTSARPLAIASSANIGFNGAVTAYGLFYAATSTADVNYQNQGNANATVYGAIVSRSTFSFGNGNMRLIYDANLFNPQQQPMLLVRVPGSWRDSLSQFF